MLRLSYVLGISAVLVLGIVLGTTLSSRSSLTSSALRQPKHNGYQDAEWTDLPSDVQDAAKTLGYNKRSWDQDLRSEHFEKEWEDLTGKQQQAAKTMGFDEVTWCIDYEDYEEQQHHDFMEDDWQALPPKIKTAAKILGTKYLIRYEKKKEQIIASIGNAAGYVLYTFSSPHFLSYIMNYLLYYILY